MGEKKAKEAEEKKKRLEEAEAKRQEMLEAQKADKAGAGGAKKAGGGGGDARREMTKTKEQLEEEKKIALSIRIKPLDLDSMDTDDLKDKAKELFNIVIALETDKYDYEQRRITQDYELNELKERQKAQLRHKALRGQEEAVRGRLGGHPRRVPGRHLEGEVRRVVQEACQEASQVVRREAWQEGWRCRDSRG